MHAGTALSRSSVHMWHGDVQIRNPAHDDEDPLTLAYPKDRSTLVKRRACRASSE